MLPMLDVYANPRCEQCAHCHLMISHHDSLQCPEVVELCRDGAMIADSHGWCDLYSCLVSLDMTAYEVTGERNWTKGCFEPRRPNAFCIDEMNE